MGDKGFSKLDMERVGLFQEMGYTTIGDRYKSTAGLQFNDQASKGKQMLPGGYKSKSALQSGYFSDHFNRVMEGEAHSDPIKLRRQHRLKEAAINIGKPFLPSSGEKKPSGLGSHYGTLAGPIVAFSPNTKPRKTYKPVGRNIYTNPAKQGTGYGYVGVTIGPYNKHTPDEYDRTKDLVKHENETHQRNMKGGAFRLNMHPKYYFDENPYKNDRPLPPPKKNATKKNDLKPFKQSSPGKSPGGMKAGTFDPYPSHSADPYTVKISRPVNVVNKSGRTFMPSAGPKSAPVVSIVEKNVIRSINPSNYRTMPTVMSY